MFKKEYLIETSDVDGLSELKLSSLFRYLQDAATEHAELLGVGQSKVLNNGMFWVITRYSVSINKMPSYFQKIIVYTYPGEGQRLVLPRLFKVTDEKGNVLIKASSSWVILDRATHHIVIDPFKDMVLPFEKYEGEEPLPNKVQSAESELVESRKVRYSDVDLNAHLNNTKYVEYIMDTHDFEFYKKYRVKHITINYNKELLADQIINIRSNHQLNEFISGDVEGQNIFDANIEFVER